MHDDEKIEIHLRVPAHLLRRLEIIAQQADVNVQTLIVFLLHLSSADTEEIINAVREIRSSRRSRK